MAKLESHIGKLLSGLPVTRKYVLSPLYAYGQRSNQL